MQHRSLILTVCKKKSICLFVLQTVGHFSVVINHMAPVWI